jgi:hypothetical protein
MIEALIIICLVPFLLLGIAIAVYGGGLVAVVAGASLAGLSGFFVYRFLRDELRRKWQLRNSSR